MKINTLIFVLLYSLFSYGDNWVCGSDLDGDGVLASSGETASCSAIGNEQFCSIGAQNCNTNSHTQYRCSLNNQSYDNVNSCQTECSEDGQANVKTWVELPIFMVPDGVDCDWGCGWFGCGCLNSVRSNYWEVIHAYGYMYNYKLYIGSQHIYTHLDTSPPENINHHPNYRIGNIQYSFGTRKVLEKQITTEPTTTYGICSPTTQTNYTCPTPGNTCHNIAGIQKCSPNQCINLDTTLPIETNPPSVSELDNGTRDATGACVDQSKMFSGRNLSCKSSGFTKDCCKPTDRVLRDSKGSALGNAISNAVIGESIATTYQVVQTGYLTYLATNNAAIAAESAQAAINGFAIDPYTIAISIAISIVTEFISCGQQDTEAAILNNSGYCHYVGKYCSKKWPLVGCVQRSKSYCCFNSKLARIMQQQGRQQLGIAWGAAKSPNCTGLTPEQFQSLDFSQIDMSEYYDDLAGQSQSLIEQNVNNAVQQHIQQIESNIQ